MRETQNKKDDVHRLIKESKFAPLGKCFERIDIFFEGGYIFQEKGNFSFGTVFDTKFDYERLSWFAGNQTEDFVKQISIKVNKYRLDNEMSLLLDELNLVTKIKS